MNRMLIAAVHNFRKASNLVDWAKRELELAGLFDKDSDYDGALGPSILETVKIFSEQGHSGGSAGITRSILNKLLDWEPLSLVKNPLIEGYADVGGMGTPLYQCTRDSTIFSEDGGKTWYKLVTDNYEDSNAVSRTKSRKVPLEAYNNGEGHSVDYRTKTAKIFDDNRQLVPLELLYELADSVSSAKGQLKSLDVMERWLEKSKDKCIQPDDVQKWLDDYRSRVISMKKTLVDSANAIKVAATDKAIMQVMSKFKEDHPGHIPGRVYSRSKMPEFMKWLKSQTKDKDLAEGVWGDLFKGADLSEFDKMWNGKTASDKEIVLSRFEEGKPADPTKNMSPEDAKEWNAQKEKHKDEFKTAQNQSKEAESVLTKNQVQTLMTKFNIPGEVGGQGKNWEATLPDEKAKNLFQKHVLREIGGYKTGWGGWVLRPDYQSKGDYMDPSSRWHYASGHLEAADVLSRFEEGKPADPTENMSPEDAKKWWAEHEKNKDNFKTAATYPILASVDTKDCQLIDRLVSQRTTVDWVTDPRDEIYQREVQKEGFFESYLPRVKKEFDETNDLIDEAVHRVLRRLIAFEKGGIPEFEELGYEVKIGKLIPIFVAPNWADYNFNQEVSILDKVFGRRSSLDLTWSFRSYVQMSEKKGWTQLSSDTSAARLTFAAMIFINNERLYNSQKDWTSFVVWRKQKMSEKGSEKGLLKSAAYGGGGPRWIKAKYPGLAEDKTPFKRGEDILYWPRTKTIMVGDKAKKAWEKFQAEIEDESVYNHGRYASIKVASRFLTADQDRTAPAKVDKYFKEVKEKNPDYTDEQAWATAWSIFCKHVEPNSPSCHQDEYLKDKTAEYSYATDIHNASRKPQTVPERHQLKILIDSVKNPLKGKFLGGPTAEESEETLRTKFKYTDAEILRLKQASTQTAGYSYATNIMTVLFVEGRKPVPFNIDTIRDINETTIPVMTDDGKMHEGSLSVTNHQSSGPLTFAQEKSGMRRETRVDIRFPIDEEGSPATSERTAFSAVAQLGRKLGFKVEPALKGYKPQTRKI